MRKTINVKGITIGEGAPKICVPIVGKTKVQVVEEALHLKTLDIDVVEWRVDFFEDVEDPKEVKSVLAEIRPIIADIPLIFTFRSAREGGQKELSTDRYLSLNRTILETGMVDILDVELFNDEKDVSSLIEEAHRKGVFVILSNHDFVKTPEKEEIIARLRKAQELGADLPKMAVMPNSSADVITLLDATNTMNELYADRPLITMSMSSKGVISRLAGELVGSALTFGAAKNVSAPGQIGVKELRDVLNLLHTNR